MSSVPERAIFPLMPAVALGFIVGVIVAALKLDDGAAFWLAVAGVVTTLAVGGLSVVRGGGLAAEQALVGALRAVGSAVLFITVYLAVVALISNGDVGWFFVWAVLALIVGLTVAQLRIRGDAEHPPAETERPAQT